MASVRARTLVKAPRRMARRLRIESQVSTWFNHLDPVGVKWSWMRRCRASQACTSGVLWVRLIVRRVRPTPGSQLALEGILFTHHAFNTDRDGSTLELEADHRRHAELENTIRDLKDGVALNHMPSGRFAANAAWLALNVLAHNLMRWVTRLGLRSVLLRTKTVRSRYVSVPGRLAQSACRTVLHLPSEWPWAEAFIAHSRDCELCCSRRPRNRTKLVIRAAARRFSDSALSRRNPR